MSAIAPVLTKERMTHEEFMDWCDEDTKADLIEGVIIVQTPASTSHERLFKFLLKVLDLYVTQRGLGEVLGSHTAVRLEEGHTYEPDLLFVAQERRHIIGEMEVNGAPDLVVEILSAGTYYHDTGAKRAGYERAGVRELWLIDPYGAEGTQVLRRDAATASFVPVKPEGDIYHSEVIPDLWLRAEWLWPERGEFPDVIAVLEELGAL
jgi:Uma2 family endonuclease